MLLQAYEPPLESLASIIEELGKNQALNTLQNRDDLLCKRRQACFANKESLYRAKSRNPIPPTILDFVNSSHFTQ